MAYDVFLYSIPKVSEDGKESLPVPDSRRQDFATMEDAGRFAADHKDQYDRVVIMDNGNDGQKLVGRYIDGKQAEGLPSLA